MVKRIISALLALLICLNGAVALAAEIEIVDAAGSPAVSQNWAMTLKVVDAQGEPMPGIEVTIYSELDAAVQTYVTDASAEKVISGLADGSYYAKAYDPTDRYSTLEWFTVPTAGDLTLSLRKLVKGSHVTVGNVTKVNGSFFTDMWGNNTSDIDVRSMINGYQTVSWSSNLTAVLDTSVVTLESAEIGARGNKTYTFTTRGDLYYNDGTPINARDYVFSLLLQSSPQAVEIGAMAYGYAHLVGFEDFNKGVSQVFTGVRLLGDNRFSMTIAGEYLPYYYELVYLNVLPYPIGELAPGCEVADDGEGAYIRSIRDANGNPQGQFTAETLRQTILDPQTGYMTHPRITSGPYQLVSYDGATGSVEFTVNPYFKGNYEGQRPLVENVSLVVVDKTDMIQRLRSGDVDILNKITDIEAIVQGTQLRDEAGVGLTTYLRSGQAFLGLACEQGPTAYESVRRAISHCLDQTTFTAEYTGTYGLPVYSHYGLGQWMASEYINTMQEYVDTYAYDLGEAVKVLVKDGWKYNDQGKYFQEGTDQVRYRVLSAREKKLYEAIADPVVPLVTVGKNTYLPLALHFANVQGSGLCQKVREMLIPKLESIGFRVTSEDVDFTRMLRCYYRQEKRTFNFFALASNFTYVYDPVLEFNGAKEYQGSLNRSGIDDKTLLKQAQTLRETKPEDRETYVERWLKLMEYYSRVLPTIPLYSNMYVDMRSADIQGYSPNNFWNWPTAILFVYRGQAPETQLPVMVTPVETETTTVTPESQPAGEVNIEG